MLEKVLDSFARCHKRQHKKALDITSVLDILAKDEFESGIQSMLTEVSDVIHESEKSHEVHYICD